MTNAFTIFEEEISETDAKVAALNLITTTLYGITCFGAENFDTLCANCISYNGKLLKKNLQAEAINISTHLFYCPFRKAGNKVMEQLRKALKVAEACLTSKPENLYVLVQILNTYIYFYQIESEFMTKTDINDLFSFIKEIVDEMEDKKLAAEGLKYLQNTKNAIKVKALTMPRMAELQFA